MDRIEFHTPFGIVFAEKSGDTKYPGIVLCVEQTDDDGMYNKQLALMECTPDIPKEGGQSLRLMIWGDDDIEDYTDKFIFFEACPGEDSKEVIWQKYLDYLRNWADERSGLNSYGTTPRCFVDWQMNVYEGGQING